MKGFKAFLLRGNIVELAIAVVIGIAFGVVITAFVKDLVTPLIAALGGQPDFAALSFTINHSKFLYGEFINALLAFVVVALVIYFLVVIPYTRLGGSSIKNCPECLSAIPKNARRCAFCTSPQPI